MRNVLNNLFLLFPILLHLLRIIPRPLFLQTFQQLRILHLDTLKLLPSKRRIQTTIHLFLLLLPIAFVHRRSYLLQQVSVFALDLRKLILLTHESLVRV